MMMMMMIQTERRRHLVEAHLWILSFEGKEREGAVRVDRDALDGPEAVDLIQVRVLLLLILLVLVLLLPQREL